MVSGDRTHDSETRLRELVVKLASLGAVLVLAGVLGGLAGAARSTTAPTLIQNMVVSLTGRGITVSPNLIVRGTVMRIQIYNHTKHIREVTVGGRSVHVKAKGRQVFILQFSTAGHITSSSVASRRSRRSMQVD